MAENNNQTESSLYQKITSPKKDDPLSAEERLFINEFLKCSNVSEAGSRLPSMQGKSRPACAEKGKRMLEKPRIQAELGRIMEEIKQENIATATEVMTYLTSVMRGEVKDQFGLDAPLSERTKAAQELAKRTVDIENRKSGEPDQLVAIKLDWSRN